MPQGDVIAATRNQACLIDQVFVVPPTASVINSDVVTGLIVDLCVSCHPHQIQFTVERVRGDFVREVCRAVSREEAAERTIRLIATQNT